MFLNKKKIKNTVLVASTLLFLSQNLLCEDIIKEKTESKKESKSSEYLINERKVYVSEDKIYIINKTDEDSLIHFNTLIYFKEKVVNHKVFEVEVDKHILLGVLTLTEKGDLGYHLFTKDYDYSSFFLLEKFKTINDAEMSLNQKNNILNILFKTETETKNYTVNLNNHKKDVKRVRIIEKPQRKKKKVNKNNIREVISDTNLKLEIPKPVNVEKIKLNFQEKSNFIKRIYLGNSSYTLYSDKIVYKDLSTPNEPRAGELYEKSKILSYDIQKVKYDNKECVFFILFHENLTVNYYIFDNKNTEWGRTEKNPTFPKDAQIKMDIGNSDLVFINKEKSSQKSFYLPLVGDDKIIEKGEDTFPKNLYRFCPITNNLYSSEPSWSYKLDDVYQYRFSTYVNKKNEKIPIFFVIYKDGGVGIYFLPKNSENEMLYYEFDKKVKINKYDFSGVILEYIDTYKGKNLLYFRIVETDGNVTTYGVPEGMF